MMHYILLWIMYHIPTTYYHTGNNSLNSKRYNRLCIIYIGKIGCREGANTIVELYFNFNLEFF